MIIVKSGERGQGAVGEEEGGARVGDGESRLILGLLVGGWAGGWREVSAADNT